MLTKVILETRGLRKQYQMENGAASSALNGVDLVVRTGEFVAVMGPSGSGKSTLLYLLGALDSPTAGEVLLDGQPLSGKSPTELALVRRRRIGFVFQFFNLLPTLTAEENIAMPLMLEGTNPARYRDQVAELLRLVDLEGQRHHRPDQLSGGQQQRVALARALANRPTILLADEPTGNLDSRSADNVLRLLRRLADQTRQTIVLVTHDSYAASVADRVVMLKDGQIVSSIDSSNPANPANPANSASSAGFAGFASAENRSILEENLAKGIADGIDERSATGLPGSR